MCKEAQGSEIHWNQDKNVTVKTIKKKQKHKSRSGWLPIESKVVREVVKTVEAESFFNFFKTRKAPEAEEDEDDESDEEKQQEIVAIENDITIAEEFANELIPKALYYYLNLMESSEHGSEGGSSDEDDGDDGDDGEDAHTKAIKKKKDKGPKAEAKKDEAKKECKQQ